MHCSLKASSDSSYQPLPLFVLLVGSLSTGETDQLTMMEGIKSYKPNQVGDLLSGIIPWSMYLCVLGYDECGAVFVLSTDNI